MRILVIGSKGFIGTHAVAYFSADAANTVFECDVMVDYEKENYFLIDATNADYQKIFQHNAFDACINCSGAASVPASLSDPFRDFTLNTYNVVKILDAIRSNQPACKFINLSSAAVYGNPAVLPVVESLALTPISPYGIHKLQAEQLCASYARFYGIPTCSLRIFSAYGNGLKKQLFWDLYQKALKNDVIELFGTGRESRDFIHVEDVVRAIGTCLNHAGFAGESINIASGVETTVASAVNTFLSCFPRFKEARFNGAVKAGDPLNWRADITVLRSMGFESSVVMEDGLQRYFQWISQK